MFSFKKLFRKRVKIEHNINIIAEFNNNRRALHEIAKLTNYISNIGDSVQVLSDLQTHPKGYRISFILSFTARIGNKRKGNRYTHYVAKVMDWLEDDSCIQRYYYNYN